MAEVKEKAVIKIEEHAVFEATTNTMLMTGEDMANYINAIFGGVFKDYAGCAIQLNSAAAAQANPSVPIYPNPDGVNSDVPMNAYYATIAFTEDPKKANSDGIKNLIPLATNNNGEPSTRVAQLMRYNSIRNRSKMYDLSQDTKDMIEPFMYRPFYKNTDNAFWNRHIIEHADYSSNVFNTVTAIPVVKVVGLNLNALMAMVFGQKDEDGNELDYLVTPFAPPVEAGMPQKVMFQVSRLKTDTLKSFVNKIYGVSSPLSATYVPYVPAK